ncbi:VWA domain-containing protein [Catelliglobosispora koreensis]|uniref:VWA domain-containing protein n=1 Tax=Catelliglobosispora koreensis TaxID=129052 RepID=UPI0004777EDC|nr:VWA domain-containing protein [Catelliglobosispora koreensis]
MIIISALGLITLATMAIRAVSADADGCSSAGIRLTVAADPAIAPAIADIGAKWTATDPSVEGDCIHVDVVAKSSVELAEGWGTWAGGLVDVAAKPAPTPSEADLPIVWIPDSSYWLGRVRTIDRELFEASAPSVASSPIVIALPESAARSLNLPAGLDMTALSKLALNLKGENALRIAITEPRRDTAGVAGAMVLADALVTSEKDLPKLVLAYRSLGAQVNNTDALWKALAASTDKPMAAPVSEQALLAYNAGGTTTPMAAAYLPDLPALDFPFAVRNHQPHKVSLAAAAFQSAIVSPQFRGLLAPHRLRAPDGTAATGFPTGHGVTANIVHVQPVTDMAKVRKSLSVWTAARTPSRIVAMVDSTSSMGQIMGAGKTRMDVMRQASVTGLSMFTDDSELGLWAFAGKGHLNLVPLAKLGPAKTPGGQRTKLETAIAGAAPQPTDASPLYQSILAGYKEILTGYKPELSNTLVIFTDGKDTTGLDLGDVQRELELLADVTRPVRVVLLGMGPDVDLAAMDSIAKTTGGAAFTVTDPRDMEAIFLAALLT